MTVSSPGPSDDGVAAFPRDVAEFLLELSIGIHRHAMYPPEHPSLQPVAESVLQRLEPVLAERHLVRIGVLRESFVMSDAGTDVESDRRHPVLRELAARFHSHEVAAVSFGEGVAAGEIKDFLARVAPEVDRGAWPLGQRQRAGAVSWRHILIEPLAYDELTLDAGRTSDEEANVDELWRALVRSAGSHLDPQKPGVSGRLATALKAQADDALQVRLVGGYLAPLVDALAEVEPGRLHGIRRGLADFIGSLDPRTRAALLREGGDMRWRRGLVTSASHALDREAVLQLLDSAAEASGQTISTSMTRLLTKLATHKGGGEGENRADGALRENIRALLDDWTLEDPNPDAYSRMLDRMARVAPEGDGDGDPSALLEIAERVVIIGLEIDEWSSSGDRALVTLLDAGRLSFVFEVADQVPRNDATDRLLETLRRPALVRRAVGSHTVEPAALKRLARSTGHAAIPPLVDGLIASQNRAARKAIFDTIVLFGDALVPEVKARLPSPYWYVTRNLLNLLASVPGDAAVDAMPFLDDSDPRVRRAALSLALRSSEQTEEALVRALGDRDERLVERALIRFRGAPTPEVLRTVVTRVMLAERSPDLRVLAIRALTGQHSPMVRESLLEVVVQGFRRADLEVAGHASVVAAALDELKLGWPQAPDVRDLLEQAAASTSPVLRALVSRRATRQGGSAHA